MSTWIWLFPGFCLVFSCFFPPEDSLPLSVTGLSTVSPAWTICQPHTVPHENVAPTNEFDFQSPGCLAKRQSNSPKHLRPPHPDAQLTRTRRTLIYGGWVWLTMFFQNSYIGMTSSMTSAAAKIRLKKNLLCGHWQERDFISADYVAQRGCICNSRKSPSAICRISIVRTCWHCCGDTHLPVETRTDTGIKTGDFWCVKPDWQSLPHTDSCHFKWMQRFPCVPLFKINTC